jgi:deoxyribodipyrimidine photo-lyase
VQRLGEKGVNAAPGPIESTLAAARARLAAVRPAAYARTRNALDGAVTGLSPYITHGLVSPTEVLTSVTARHELDVQHKLVYELGWRAFFRHVWQHRGQGILRSLHEGPLPDHAYASELPDDIRQAATGVPVVDMAVRELYANGTLHNHARMWLASYVVHVRKLHWRAGADWMYAHLLDGDLASNHLSWQWVAGTGSSKPYLFNADNVARYAPAEWHSPGSVVDTSYEALDRMARTPGQRWLSEPSTEHDRPVPADEPALLTGPPLSLGAIAPDAATVEGREVWLVHPWSLGELPILPLGTVVIGLCLADFHRAWPWSPGRWAFVGRRMAELAPLRWHGDAAAVGAALQGARRVRCIAEPHLAPWLPALSACVAAPALFPPVERPCGSFSQWWNHASRGLDTATDLLSVNEVPAW